MVQYKILDEFVREHDGCTVVNVEIDGEVMEIDKNTLGHLEAFWRYGLKTTMSCEGHKWNWPMFKIWFDEDTKDEDIYSLRREIGKILQHRLDNKIKPYSTLAGHFAKEIRSNGGEWNATRWVYSVTSNNNESAVKRALGDLVFINEAIDNLSKQ